ncbi:hypothetical protein E2C01_064757 [Portunus trituberculatus]|uniref:Uncharacterized protein n=1 Tax=Portunus trituberculatus TaxID=210409 RepID=A0A5B7HMR6_PORTR|nr:hypothetical protein [Portunus trituberculatus]
MKGKVMEEEEEEKEDEEEETKIRKKVEENDKWNYWAEVFHKTESQNHPSLPGYVAPEPPYLRERDSRDQRRKTVRGNARTAVFTLLEEEAVDNTLTGPSGVVVGGAQVPRARS